MEPQQTDYDSMVQDERATRHDTVVLGDEGPRARQSAPVRHDTIAMQRPVPGMPAPRESADGWQAVNRWREQLVEQAPTAWSQIPPFHGPAPVQVIVRRNNAAVIGATLGSTSLFLSLLPLIGVVAWLLAPIGLACSIAGLIVGSARRVGRVGALWGVVTSSVALLICFIWASFLLAL